MPQCLFFLCVCAACCVSLRVPRTLGFVLIIFLPSSGNVRSRRKNFLFSPSSLSKGAIQTVEKERKERIWKMKISYFRPSPPFPYSPPFSSCRQKALRQWNKDKRIIFPGKTVSSLFFGLTEPSEKFVSSHGCFCLVSCTAYFLK